MVDKTFTDLPHDHITLLQELATQRANEKAQYQLLTEMQEEAVLRLVAYKDVDDNCFANVRFLDLKDAVGEGGDIPSALTVLFMVSTCGIQNGRDHTTLGLPRRGRMTIVGWSL